MFDTPQMPLFRMVQVVNSGDTTGYFPGSPAVTQVVRRGLAARPARACGMSCQRRPTLRVGEVLAGPLRTLDLSGFPAPLTVK